MILEDLHTKTSYEHPRSTFKQAPLMQSILDLNAWTSAGGFEQDLNKIFSQGPAHVMQGHPEDFTSRSSRKGLYKIMQDSFPPGSPQDLLIRSCTRACKDLAGRTSPGSPQDLLIRSCAISCKDLLERTSPGSPQDLLIRICVRAHKDFLEDFSRIFTRSFHKDLCKIMQGPL